MSVLVLNCGSSSVKFQVLTAGEPPGGRPPAPVILARGLVERIGAAATAHLEVAGQRPRREPREMRDHDEAVAWVVERVRELGGHGGPAGMGIDVVGHRVVHGGERFSASVVVDDEVLRGIEQAAQLAPLHNRPSLAGMRAARAALGPRVPMVAVFDTAFHATLPERARRYALPENLVRRHGIRRFGFHGTSYRAVLARYAEITGTPPGRVTIVALHLGNGCSAAAIKDGVSVDTSMGFTPLEGLVMGTRSGDLDPSIVAYLIYEERLTADGVERLLNERSGLVGVAGSSDMRDLLARAGQGDARARLAVDLFAYRARKYLGAYLAALGGADAVVFTGGIGERSPEVRAAICEGMAWCGLRLDPAANAAASGAEGRISADGARLPVYVVPTDEERVIAADCLALCGGR